MAALQNLRQFSEISSARNGSQCYVAVGLKFGEGGGLCDSSHPRISFPDSVPSLLNQAIRRRNMNRTLVTFGGLALGCIAWATPSLADPGRGATTLCYLWANNPSPAIGVPYEPSPTYSFNAQNRAGGISVTRTATGTYSVKCTGVGGGIPWGAAGHVQVSADLRPRTVASICCSSGSLCR
jgi:hypothetical protein